MKKKALSAIVVLAIFAMTLVGCASMPNKKSWATVQKIPLTEAFLYVSQNGDIVIYKEGSEENDSENDKKAESETGTTDSSSNDSDGNDTQNPQDSEDNGNNNAVPGTGIEIIYQANDLRADAQLELYNYSVAYISNSNELVLVSALTGESKVCDTNVTYLNGEGYSNGINQGVLLIAYKVDSTGAIVSANQFPV